MNLMKSNTEHLPGGTTHYAVSDLAVRYTLKDNGFVETKNGNFQFERVLSKQVMDKKAPKLKIAISKDLSDLTINTVVANGLRKIDLYKTDDRVDQREFAEFILQALVENNVLDIVD